MQHLRLPLHSVEVPLPPHRDTDLTLAVKRATDAARMNVAVDWLGTELHDVPRNPCTRLRRAVISIRRSAPGSGRSGDRCEQ